ncbi:MAG: GTPase HflX [Dictyoglomus sp.]|nr:GTPase HflX [Dictyoglomus sp.]MCX7941710.1 GTPase HflX [Dictyoglomaceae bacterium]MDW8189068.1 GTPase HflX [Dictyoglomus sp.]
MEIEKAILVVKIGDNEGLEELKLLSKTAGAKVEDIVFYRKDSINPSYFISRGKLEELEEKVLKNKSELVIFNEDLSPTQLKNLEKIIPCKIIDRTTLILDIFAQHARTKEGKIQVELAQLEYLLPRLVGRGEVLSRLGGGIGTRGPGETKLEVDRRKIRRRIYTLKEQLKEVQKEREVQRKNRRDIYQVALVGYTNVGKSSLFNLLTHSNVKVEDQLFATLDPTVRKVRLENNWEFLIIDTVGFIKNLPPSLMTAFRATLEEVLYVDLIVHLIDISNPNFVKQIEVVEKILEEIGVENKPIIRAYNKIDLISRERLLEIKKTLDFYPSVFISVIKNQGIDKLKKLIIKNLLKGTRRYTLSIDYNLWKDFQKYTGKIYIEKQEFNEKGVKVWARIPKEYKRECLPYIKKNKALA